MGKVNRVPLSKPRLAKIRILIHKSVIFIGVWRCRCLALQKRTLMEFIEFIAPSKIVPLRFPSLEERKTDKAVAKSLENAKRWRNRILKREERRRESISTLNRQHIRWDLPKMKQVKKVCWKFALVTRVFCHLLFLPQFFHWNQD